MCLGLWRAWNGNNQTIWFRTAWLLGKRNLDRTESGLSKKLLYHCSRSSTRHSRNSSFLFGECHQNARTASLAIRSRHHDRTLDPEKLTAYLASIEETVNKNLVPTGNSIIESGLEQTDPAREILDGLAYALEVFHWRSTITEECLVHRSG